MSRRATVYADDATESVGLLLKLRIPSLVVGLVLGMGLSLMTSRFEGLIVREPQLAFFIPFIVYLSAATGTQTESIYIRSAARHRTAFHKYLLKEFFIGLLLGLLFGGAVFLIILLWLASLSIAVTVGLAIFLSTTSATVLALVITNLFRKEHQDPAVGAAPIATVLQDALSLIIYFVVATLVLAYSPLV